MKVVRGQRFLAQRGTVFYFRRAVPVDARASFGGRSEVWKSLKTSDVRVARNRLQRYIDEFEEVIASIRGEISPKAIAGAPYNPIRAEVEVQVRSAFKERMDRIVAHRRNDPAERANAIIRLDGLKAFRNALSDGRGLSDNPLPLDVEWQCEALCERHGWELSREGDVWWSLVDLVARAQLEAAERQIQSLEGRPSVVVDEAFDRAQFYRDEELQAEGGANFGAPVSLMVLFEDYVTERKPSPATVKSFRAKVKSFGAFLGHDDARRIMKRDVVLWKDHLLARGKVDGSGLSAKTVRETYLPAIRSTLARGVEGEQLRANVARNVGVAGRKKTPRLRSAGFTDEEAQRILAATFTANQSKLSVERQHALRWMPWLLAYTGARVNEIAQLRAQDIYKINGIWVLRITPEAGSTKDGNARVVALHPHLVEQGFPALIEQCQERLFYDPARSRDGTSQNPQSKKVGEFLARWVRKDVGINDPGVQPNHGWRHRFKTTARDCRIMPEVRDYIQGHAPRSEGEDYGDVSPQATFEEIRRMPTYVVEEHR